MFGVPNKRVFSDARGGIIPVKNINNSPRDNCGIATQTKKMISNGKHSTVVMALFVSIITSLQTTTVVGTGTKGDNVSFLLNSFQRSYDRRLRPNYGGKLK